MKYYMGMDIGGTFARIRAVREDGILTDIQKRRGCTFNTSGYQLSKERYQEAALSVLKEWNLLPDQCAGFCAAVSGVDTPGQAEDCGTIFQELGFPPETVTVYNDCEIVLQLTDRPAIVLVAGTGSAAFGKTGSGSIVRCGGWGHLLSDEGSAIDIGKRVLRAVGDYMDGRNDCPILYRLFEQQSDIRCVDDMDRYLNENIMDKPKIAGFAVLADKAYAQGEPAAGEILRSCSDALFELTKDTYRKVVREGAPPEKLFLWGSVLTNNQVISKRLIERVSDAFPGLEPVYPDMEAVDIALMTAQKGNRV